MGIKENKFNPEEFGFVFNNENDEYLLIHDNKIIVRLLDLRYGGIYVIYSITHKVFGDSSESKIYSGKIPDNKFANNLFENLDSDYFLTKMEEL